MKLKKRAIKFIMISLICCFCLRTEAAPAIKITNGHTVSRIYTGQSSKLKVKRAAEYKSKKIKWSLSNPRVGTISTDGIFKAKKAGKATIYAQIIGTNLKSSVDVEVKKFIKTKSITINNMKKKLGVGSTLQLTANISPINAVYKDVVWKSSKPKIASISAKGKIKAKKTGKTKITASVKNTKISKTFNLTVTNAIPLEALEIEGAKTALTEGETMNLSVIKLPSDTTYKNIQWSSSNKSIATVSEDGKVYAGKPGNVTITVQEVDSKVKTSITIKVNAKVVPCTGIKFVTANPQKIEKGKSVQLKAQVMPVNATQQKIIWSSSDTTKAVVSENGVVTAIRPTEYVDIIAKTADGKYKASYNLQITAKNGFLTKQDLDKMALTSVKKVMIVAHPDDETFWGGSHLLDSEYLVVALTNGWHNIRKNDFYNVMSHTNDKCIILSYPDTKREYWKGTTWAYDTDMLSTCQEGLLKDLELILGYKNWDTVVTHNPGGEYNKYLHKMTNKLVTQTFKKVLGNKSKLYYFGHYYKPSTAIPGEQIEKENLEIKNKLIKLYLPTAKGALDAFGHMLPYENWILASDWK